VALLQNLADRAKLVDMSPRLLRRVGNAHIDWSRFDSDVYCAANYRDLRSDDEEIAEKVRDFFADASKDRDTSEWRAIDVGTGANLYPAFAMLPFSKFIDLREFSPTNVKWLREQCREGFDGSWDEFWRVYNKNHTYEQYFNENNVRHAFRDKAVVEVGSIFDLPEREWDLGTMFFVACSLTRRRDEFRRAVRSFVRSLKPGAPVAAAFMTKSGGYQVGDEWFPAVSVSRFAIRRTLRSVCDPETLKVEQIKGHVSVRPGVGMALATGFAR
jgi:hypothetical protein